MKGDFGLKIDFQKNSENPNRIFKSMAQLIEALQALDYHLAFPFRNEIEPYFLLEDIETGSLTTWLRTNLKEINDDHLISLEWKKILGRFLVRAKYCVLTWLGDEKEIDSREKVFSLQAKIDEAAHEEKMNTISIYSPPKEVELLSDIVQIKESLEIQNEHDATEYISPQGVATICRTFKIDGDKISELLTMKTISSELDLILQIKKPDYLGNSKWVFRHQKHFIECSITDFPWLTQFHSRTVEVLPGDAIRAAVKYNVSYGFSGEVISEKYEIIKVIEVIKVKDPEQRKFSY